MQRPSGPIPWLEAGENFPPIAQAWGPDSPAPGLLAAGGTLSVDNLYAAYSEGIFPWFSDGQPVLWWSTDPRMVLQTDAFVLHRSLRKKLQQVVGDSAYELRIDSDFAQVIEACAHAPRSGQAGTWIVPSMVQAYCELHGQGFAHSVELWHHGQLQAGLYCVALGRAVFGESMFTRITDGSKIALAALVALCRANAVPQIDCQQVTSHLASLGARPMDRGAFVATMKTQLALEPVRWRFDPVYWQQLGLRSPNLPPSSSDAA